MDEVTRLALAQAWEDGWSAGYECGAYGDATIPNPYVVSH